MASDNYHWFGFSYKCLKLDWTPFRELLIQFSYNLAFSASTNRITTSGFSYDASGDLTNDTVHAYDFDASGKVKKVDNTSAYTYDGEGQRVRKLVGENTRFIYGIDGKLVAESDGSSGNLKKEYVYTGGTLITIEPTAVNSNGTQYAIGDHLGTPRIIMNSTGSVVARHDYMPFGEELFAGTGGRTTGMGFSSNGDNNRKKFTGYERDTETGLDFAQARYHASTQGRFTSPDPLQSSARMTNPQTWNRYAYVGNNPVKFVDPSGLLGGAPSSIHSINSHDGREIGTWSGNNSELSDAEAEYETRLAETREAMEEGEPLDQAQQQQPTPPQPTPSQQPPEFALTPAEQAALGEPPPPPDTGGMQLARNQDVLGQFYCLFVAGGYGSRATERSVWVSRGGNGYTVTYWPWSAAYREESWPAGKEVPPGTIATAHTHSNDKPKPSTSGGKTGEGDFGTSKQLHAPVYVITRDAIWRQTGINGKSQQVQVAFPGWWKPFEKLKCK